MLTEYLGKELLYLDGAMGTLLQEAGLQAGEYPEIWNITKADLLVDIHKRYFEAGSHIVLTNTFGANPIKFESSQYSLEEIVTTAVHNAKLAKEQAQGEQKRYVALDIGPTGQLMKPFGTLSFESAYNAFAQVVRAGVKAGADLIYIETMSDTYEMKAAVLAAKEHSELPVVATFMFDETKKLLTGADIVSAVALLEGLRVDALGMNCGLGPKQMYPIMKEMATYTSLPLVVKANAGLPKQKDGETYYEVEPETFANEMQEMIALGVSCLGGCCGTTPAHIQALAASCRTKKCKPNTEKNRTLVGAYGAGVEIGEVPVIVGERMNPTGRKVLKQALQEQRYDVILKEGIAQEEQGAHILDINAGLPDIDEEQVLTQVVQELQGITSLPLQIDTSDIKAMESAMRIYNGKPMVNSVNGKQESMNEVFPLVQKYGGVVIALALDETGIPNTAEGRIRIAKNIIAEAKKYGIAKKDIVVDALAMTISSEPNGAKVTLETLTRLRKEVGVHTVLGVSNISFGLPSRAVVNSHFYSLALYAGLSVGIINPLAQGMKDAYYSYCALQNYDDNCMNYIEAYKDKTIEQKENKMPSEEMTLYTAIEKGLREDALFLSQQALQEIKPLAIIESMLIPALDTVGKGFEEGTVFLPQLLMSAEAAKAAFGAIKAHMGENGEEQRQAGKVILATVKGDIHDIGKNIVKVLLENYGFEVLDLGKDVEPQKIVDTAIQEGIVLIGLSALMTTTVTNMEITIRLIREQKPECKVMVGGAVLNQEYADMIGADFYGKDAMQSVEYAKKILR